MSTITTQEQAIILQHLPEQLKTALTRPLAIHATVLKHVPGAAQLSYDECWKRYVHPINSTLALQAFADKAASGIPVRLTVTGGNAPQTVSGQRTRLDVSGYGGRNKIEKIMHFVASTTVGLSYDDVHRRACELNKTHEVIA